MPNVPRVPGVPNLTSYLADAIVLLVADALLPGLTFDAPAWGIFEAGEEAIEINSVLTFDYRQDWAIADYPVENGAFQSYDKVQMPYDVRLRITSGPSIGARQLMVEELKTLGNSLELFDVVTPEMAYVDLNVSHVDYNRKAQSGAGMIIADVWFVEIRQDATAAFSNTSQPSEAGRQNAGNVQPQTPPANVFAPNLSFF